LSEKEPQQALVELGRVVDVVTSPAVDPPFGAESFLVDVADHLEDGTPSSRDYELGARAGGECCEIWLRFPRSALNDQGLSALLQVGRQWVREVDLSSREFVEATQERTRI